MAPPKGAFRKHVEKALVAIGEGWRQGKGASREVCLTLHASLFRGAVSFAEGRHINICSPTVCRSSYSKRHSCKLYRTIEKVLSSSHPTSEPSPSKKSTPPIVHRRSMAQCLFLRDCNVLIAAIRHEILGHEFSRPSMRNIKRQLQGVLEDLINDQDPYVRTEEAPCDVLKDEDYVNHIAAPTKQLMELQQNGSGVSLLCLPGRRMHSSCLSKLFERNLQTKETEEESELE